MNVQNIICATIVFVAYCRLGYYKPWELFRAISDYVAEKRRLYASVHVVSRWILPVGTMMTSIDDGWLPADKDFPEEMVKLRRRYGEREISYAGKFAVLPGFRGDYLGIQLIRSAIVDWSYPRGAKAAVMIVNSRQVSVYLKMGGEEIARVEAKAGLRNAPGALILLDYEKAPFVRRLLRASQKLPDREIRLKEAAA